MQHKETSRKVEIFYTELSFFACFWETVVLVYPTGILGCKSTTIKNNKKES